MREDERGPDQAEEVNEAVNKKMITNQWPARLRERGSDGRRTEKRGRKTAGQGRELAQMPVLNRNPTASSGVIIIAIMIMMLPLSRENGSSGIS